MATELKQPGVILTKSCEEASEVIEAGDARLIDVRSPAEYSSFHSPLSENQPLEHMNQDVISQIRKTQQEGKDLYVICHTGGRGRKAAEKLINAGLAEVTNIAGGMQEWDRLNLPVRRGRAIMSLERQIRIVAGLLILTGVLLAQLVSPSWIWLSGFVGAGLIFAGMTDVCGMGLLLARMPWNQSRKHDSDAVSTGPVNQCSPN